MKAANTEIDDDETTYEMTWPNASRTASHSAQINTVGYTWDGDAHLFEFYAQSGDIVLAVPEITACRMIIESTD